MLDQRGLRIGLVAAAVAALVILVGLFGDAIRIGCLVVIALVAVISAPGRVREEGWWILLAIGALASIAGAIVAQSATTLGGLIAALGGVAVIAAAAIGFPVDE